MSVGAVQAFFGAAVGNLEGTRIGEGAVLFFEDEGITVHAFEGDDVGIFDGISLASCKVDNPCSTDDLGSKLGKAAVDSFTLGNKPEVEIDSSLLAVIFSIMTVTL